MLKKISYFKRRGQTINHKMRTGQKLGKHGVNKDGYRLTQARKKVMFRKGLINVLIVIASFALLAYGVITLLS